MANLKGGYKMKQRIYVFKKHNKYKMYEFSNKEKASRFYLRCKRRGLCAQII